MFLHMSVILFTEGCVPLGPGGVCASGSQGVCTRHPDPHTHTHTPDTPWTHTSWIRTPHLDTPPDTHTPLEHPGHPPHTHTQTHTVNKRAVRILLECFLIVLSVHISQSYQEMEYEMLI